MNYGEKIARLRKSKNMTQEELGKVLNVTYQAVSKWERGESLPDFATMSQMAKYFQVPLEYFEDGESKAEEAYTASPVAENVIGTCTVCGRMLKEEEAHATSPKIICKACAERQREEAEREQREKEDRARRIAVSDAKEQIGKGVDAKLVVSLLAAAFFLVILAICCVTSKDVDDRMILSVLTVFVPLAVFATVIAVFDFIADLRDKDTDVGYSRNLSLIVGGAFALVVLVLALVIYLTGEKNGFYIGLMIVGAIVSLTFVSQIMLGNVIKEIFTMGGFSFKLPGFIFSLSVESILLMIILKVVLGIVSVIVFLVTTVVIAVVSIFGSVIMFIPAMVYKTAKDKNAKQVLKENK